MHMVIFLRRLAQRWHELRCRMITPPAPATIPPANVGGRFAALAAAAARCFSCCAVGPLQWRRCGPKPLRLKRLWHLGQLTCSHWDKGGSACCAAEIEGVGCVQVAWRRGRFCSVAAASAPATEERV